MKLTSIRIAFLAEIADANAEGRSPSKADLTRNEPHRTRANHYVMLDEMMRDGLIANEAHDMRAYRLIITDKGRRALALHS